MGAEENKATAEAAYAAFARGDAAAAMEAIDDGIEWVVGGDTSVSGTKRGKEEVGAYWGQLAEKETKVTITRCIAEDSTVVALTDVEMGGETFSSADVLEYNDAGRLVRFESFGGEDVTSRIWD